MIPTEGHANNYGYIKDFAEQILKKYFAAKVKISITSYYFNFVWFHRIIRENLICLLNNPLFYIIKDARSGLLGLNVMTVTILTLA